VIPRRSHFSIEGRSSLHPVKASTSDLAGWLELSQLPDGKLDNGPPVSGRLEVPVESMKSGIDLYDRELRRRLDARRYPLIVAELLAVHEVEPLRRYQMAGNLTFNGVTRRAEGVLAVNQLDERTIEAVGEHTFDVRDFGIVPPRVLLFAVYPDINVKLHLVAERA
jgi:polyisoprenoid-binding protein YceI